jgi:hypothetical protein
MLPQTLHDGKNVRVILKIISQGVTFLTVVKRLNIISSCGGEALATMRKCGNVKHRSLKKAMDLTSSQDKVGAQSLADPNAHMCNGDTHQIVVIENSAYHA